MGLLHLTNFVASRNYLASLALGLQQMPVASTVVDSPATTPGNGGSSGSSVVECVPTTFTANEVLLPPPPPPSSLPSPAMDTVAEKEVEKVVEPAVVREESRPVPEASSGVAGAKDAERQRAPTRLKEPREKRKRVEPTTAAVECITIVDSDDDDEGGAGWYNQS